MSQPIDTRERILLRILAALAETYTPATLVRNRGLLRNDTRPAIALLDGDEKARLTGDRRGRVAMSFELMTMTPQIFFVPETRKPTNDGLGEEVNAFRLQIIRVIAQDAELQELVGSEGNIAYMGMESDLKSGGLLDGQCRVDFAFTYVLDPYEQEQ